MSDYQETIIRIDHKAQTTEVWTANRGMQTRLKRFGFTEAKRQGRGMWLLGTKKQVSFRRPRARVGVQRGQGRFRKAQDHAGQ